MMKKLAFLIGAFAAIVTMGMTFDAMRSPDSSFPFGVIAWAISPYGFLAILIKSAHSKAAIIGALILCVLISLFGLVVIIDMTYIHLDAQGGLIYLFAPLWQWVGLLIFALPILLLNKIKKV